jgi:hypothetical protein
MKPPATTAKPAKDNGLGEMSPRDLHEILSVMQAVNDGNFSVRLPRHWTGVPGKIADTFNAIVASNERMAAELQRVGHAVGKQGCIKQRLTVGRAS